MSEENGQLVETLVAIRSDGLTLRKRVLDLPAQKKFMVCLAKLTAFDAAITMEIDELRENERE